MKMLVVATTAAVARNGMAKTDQVPAPAAAPGAEVRSKARIVKVARPNDYLRPYLILTMMHVLREQGCVAEEPTAEAASTAAVL